MDLHDALTQIAVLRRRSAEASQFRGYKAILVALTGLVAVAGAVLQPRLFPGETLTLSAYAGYWSVLAILAATPVAVRIVVREWFGGRSLDRELTRLAAMQFLPCVIAGAVITFVIVRQAEEYGPALPGLWQVLFSLGILSSCRLLPPATFGIGIAYFAAGVYHLARARGADAFDPWIMGGTFGLGQLATAIILYWTLERGDERETEE